jgi:transcriptional regulator with XRE-family HTH domain
MTSNKNNTFDLQLRLAKHVKAWRASQKLTQERLAVKANIALRHLQKIERGEVNVTLETISKLAYALDVDPVELIERQEHVQ